ncbi:3-dehydrosphinganine reductase TSC10A-like [Triticum urartu]|uniref:3-dehydrosphinganine reductase n=1 Tax=Triticum urartu TaxID=4572 RepID=A0A8R7QQH7_TRIUA|nr:3-dehydrosphinganine reductase TSC10A-like [Triticum urartu]
MAAALLLLLLLLVPPVGLLAALAFLTRPRAARIPLKGRHFFITGGSSGIGLALATAAAREGARVSILARNAARLEDARAAIRLATGQDVGVHQADVRDAAAVASALDAAGPVDVLVCNHGVFVAQELEKQDMEEVKWMVDINLMGTFHLIKAALPAMKARTRETSLPASIAIMSSQAGQVGVYGYTAYSASKFALTGLAESLQHEVVSDDIHVSLIFPPDTETPGLVEEKKKRPELTTIIADSSGGMKADDVAMKALTGIKSGRFIIPCNFEGAMLAIATSGLTPQSSPLIAFVEVIGAGLMRFVALCFQWNWFSTIENWCAKNKKHG